MKVKPNTPLPMMSQTSGWVCIAFHAYAVGEVFLKLKGHFEEENIPHRQNFSDMSLFAYSSLVEDKLLMEKARGMLGVIETPNPKTAKKAKTIKNISDSLSLLEYIETFHLLLEKSTKKVSLPAFRDAVA